MVERRCSSCIIAESISPSDAVPSISTNIHTAAASGNQGCSLVQPSVELPEQLRPRNPPDLGGAWTMEVPDTG
jgi:hypothetical protein